MTFDHIPAAQRLAELVSNVPEEALGDPTPCGEFTVGDLLDHIGIFALGFTEAAEKSGDPEAGRPRPADVAQLPEDWRRRIPDQLGTLAEAWQDPDAWTGTTRAGGLDLPGEVGAAVALEELVVHGWDLARATGQPFTASDAELEVVAGFLGTLPDEIRGRGAYGPVPPVADGASRLDQVIALSGRDPGWSAGG